MARGSRRTRSQVNTDENNSENENDSTRNGSSSSTNPSNEMRQRNRAVAEREASRLARPERRSAQTLGHASRFKSAVTSTPFGYNPANKASAGGDDDDDHDGGANRAARRSEQGQDEWCGPFSVARQMIAKREEARRKREEEQEKDEMHHPLDEIIEEVEMEKKRKAHPSLQWRGQVPMTGSEGSTGKFEQQLSIYAKRRKRVESQTKKVKVPSLFQTCVDFVVSNFEYVEALGDVDSTIRRTICEELVAKHKFNGAAFDAIAETGIEALEVIDCVEVTQDQLAEHLEKLIPAGLRYLSLHNAGRCFGPQAVNAIISADNASLFALSITGAYLLYDADIAKLMTEMMSTLSSLEFKACPNLGVEFCKSLNTSFSSTKGKGCLLELALEDLSLTKKNLISIAADSDALRNLKSLKLRRIGGTAVDDEAVVKLLEAVGDNIESIDLSYNFHLTDETLSAIRKCNVNGSLRSLELADLKNLTAAGLEALFTYGIKGLPNPPRLRKLSVASCNYDAVTDEVIDLVTKASSLKLNANETTARPMVNNNVATMGSLAGGRFDGSLSSIGGLVYLNITGSCCSDTSMESLAATSASSIRELDVSFCPNITDKGLGYLVSKASNQMGKVHTWGCAQLTDEFFDGHGRVGDTSFEIIGAWMKRAGSVALR